MEEMFYFTLKIQLKCSLRHKLWCLKVKIFCIKFTLRQLLCVSVPFSVNGAVTAGCILSGEHSGQVNLTFFDISAAVMGLNCLALYTCLEKTR